MKYEIRITQESDGEVGVSFAEGEGSVADGRCELAYNYDGADYRLTVTNGKMRHERTGEISLEMNFEEGKRTECVISDGANRGFFEIFTRRISVKFIGTGMYAECEYSDGADGRQSRVEVAVKAI